MINANGARWNGRGFGPPNFPLWNWEARTYRGEDFYSVEVKIPFDVLGRMPELGETWQANFCRNICTGPSQDRYTRWGTGAFHDPESFVAVTFGRKGFEEEIRKLGNEIGKSQGEFLKLEGSAFYKGEISPHLERWNKLEEKTVNLDRLSPLELWEVYEQLGAYEAVVNNLKREFLRQSLFAE